MAEENIFVVAALYKFVSLPDFAALQAPLLSFCQTEDIKGTILLASEGINGTIVGSRSAIDALLTFLRTDSRLTDLEHKESYSKTPPFERIKVRLKSEIVTLGIPEIDPNIQVGTYISPHDWNNLITDPEVMVIDTRNDYEVAIGTFKKAENPHTQSFREFPEYVNQHLDPTQHKKIALFCTGGIRCEKASAYLLAQGFEEVYHLKGGILKYLEEVPATESLWTGECFVFDERVAVSHGLELGNYQLCFSCGYPISEIDKASPKYDQGISCVHCFDSLTAEKMARQREKWRQHQLVLQRQSQTVSDGD